MISLEGIVRALDQFKGNDSSEAIVIKLIQLYGLSFRPTPQNMETLREASASEDLLKAIATARLPPPQPIVNQGRLAVICEPVDCDVRLNGNLLGTTTRGQAAWIALADGPVTVSAANPNYEPIHGERQPLVRQNELTRMKAEFKISRVGLMNIGADLFQRMRRAMHTPDSRIEELRPGETSALRAAGTLYLHMPAGHCAVWPVVAWFWDKNEARFELSRLRARLSESYVLTRTASGDSWDRTAPTIDAQELESGLRLISEGQLPKLMESLDDPSLTMIAVEPNPVSGNLPVFQAEGASQTYLVTLDAAYRPGEIKLRSGTRMLYSDYSQQGSTYYPKTTQVILPEGAQGIEARFDTVQIEPLPKPASSKKPKRR